MTKLHQFFFQPGKGPASLLLIRLPVGLIFLTQGILKFIDPNMGPFDSPVSAFRILISQRISLGASKLFVGAGLVGAMDSNRVASLAD